jgi:hypothetical protein
VKKRGGGSLVLRTRKQGCGVISDAMSEHHLRTWDRNTFNHNQPSTFALILRIAHFASLSFVQDVYLIGLLNISKVAAGPWIRLRCAVIMPYKIA